MLATQVKNFVLESLIAVPTVAGEDTAVAVAQCLGTFVNPDERDIVRTITQLSCAVKGTNRDPRYGVSRSSTPSQGTDPLTRLPLTRSPKCDGTHS